MCAQWILPLQWKYVQHKHSISNINSAHAGHQVQQVKKLFKVLETCSFQYCTHFFFFFFHNLSPNNLACLTSKKISPRTPETKEKTLLSSKLFFLSYKLSPQNYLHCLKNKHLWAYFFSLAPEHTTVCTILALSPTLTLSHT